MHGYEMIQEIGERSGGAWRPSPGSVYPTLQLLEDEGLIVSASEGGKKLFTLTDSGRTEAESGPEAPWEEAGRGVDWESVNEIRQAGFGLMEAFGQVWKTGSGRGAPRPSGGGQAATSPLSLRSDSASAAVAESLSLPAMRETAAPVNSPSMRTVVASPSGVSE